MFSGNPAVGLRCADILPVAVFCNQRGDSTSGGHEGSIRIDNVAVSFLRNVGKHRRIQHLDTGKGQQPAAAFKPVAVHSGKPGDESLVVDGDRVEIRVMAEHQRHRMRMVFVKPIYAPQIDIADDIGVDDHKCVFVPEIGDVANGAARPQDLRLVSNADRGSIGLGLDVAFDSMRQVMGVDHNLPAAGRLQLSDRQIQNRPAGDRKQGFGGVARERMQAGAESGSQDHGLHESVLCKFDKLLKCSIRYRYWSLDR